MARTLQELPPHPVRSLLPALGVMEDLGFGRQACLKGTGLLLSQLESPDERMSLQQELAFYRNTLELTGDQTIGLQLGEVYVPQRYGLFGYALMSASTFRHALSLAENFGRLTLSFFTFRFRVEGARTWFSFTEPPPIEQALIDLYLDRDMSAARVDFSVILGEPVVFEELHLHHDGHGSAGVYRDYFGTGITFGSDESRCGFNTSLLDRPLPQSDPESSRHFQQQCQLLIAKLTTQGHFVDDVRMLILARPGFFPDIEFVADKMGMSTRTLRRRLKEENSSYRELMDEIRFGLAREYLASTDLAIEEICGLLGYSESGNFSHAFRRWSGQSPRDWRRAVTAGAVAGER